MQSARSTSTMKIKALPTILTCVNFLLVQGLDLPGNNSNTNPATNTTRRILNGSPADLADFPFLVKMNIAGSLGAGSIITDHWILTAGHCVYQQECSAVIDIFPTTWDRSIKPLNCWAHPDYAKTSNAYDIGLIEVRENLLSGGTAKTIPLPAPGTVYPPGTMAVVPGWGLTETNDVPDGLLRGEFRVEEWDYCNRRYLEGACEGVENCVPRDMPRRLLCLQGHGDPIQGVCFGDSGGPAIIDGVLAGIVSFGISKDDVCTPGAPSMHVTVVDYLPWIFSHIAPEMDTSGIEVQPEF